MSELLGKNVMRENTIIGCLYRNLIFNLKPLICCKMSVLGQIIAYLPSSSESNEEEWLVVIYTSNDKMRHWISFFYYFFVCELEIIKICYIVTSYNNCSYMHRSLKATVINNISIEFKYFPDSIAHYWLLQQSIDS